MPRATSTRLVCGLDPVHPGELLLEEFFKPLFPKIKSPSGVDLHAIAKRLKMHAGQLKAVVDGRAALTVEDAMRLSVYFGTSVEVWINLQNNYELRRLEQSARYSDILSIQPHPTRKRKPKIGSPLIPLTTY